VRWIALIGLIALWAVPAAAAPLRILPSRDAWPVWSPDGRKLAFTRIANGTMDLYVARADTNQQRRIARNHGQLEPSWSPDSTELAYTSGGRIYVADLAERKDRGRGLQPTWRPGSSELAVVRDGSLLVGGEVWARNVVGTPSWCADGSAVAFARDDGVWMSRGPDSEQRLAAVANAGSPAWSPDCTALAYAADDRMWLAVATGSRPPQPISPRYQLIGNPSWKASGDMVVFSTIDRVVQSTRGGTTSFVTWASGLGAAISSRGWLAYTSRRFACPGQIGVRVADGITGTCTVAGTLKADVLEGSPREGDVILAGAGNDQIHANDGHTDTVNCGPGRDTVWGDRTDRLTGCEVIHR
jgi:dipeptidyl aminopeptidase/acylaminoacyl peptidase